MPHSGPRIHKLLEITGDAIFYTSTFQDLSHAGQAAEGDSTPLIKGCWSYVWYSTKAYSGQKELLFEANKRLEKTPADSFCLQQFNQERVQARTVLAVAVAYSLASRLPYGGSDPPIA